MIYLDNAASTAPAPEVLEALTAAARQHFGNPASAHGLGAAASRILEEARAQVGRALGAGTPAEVIFTSGGTEADALGILGATGRARGRHLVITAIEHPAVLRTAESLTALGWTTTAVPPTAAGVVRTADVLAAVRPDTAVVAVMLANNELGTVQPVAEIAAGLERVAATVPGQRRPHLHVDAVQAFGFIPFRAPALGADTIALSGHKIHGPKGTGALWVRPGVTLRPLWDGGRQERGLRSGTENVPGWVGLGCAAARAIAFRDEGGARALADLRDRLEQMVIAAIPGARPTAAGEAPRTPHISSLALGDLPAEALLHALEARGVFASAGSACASRTGGPSHVLRAVGIDEQTAVLRFSLSRDTTAADVEGAVVALQAAVAEVGPTAARRRT